tara:strand:+ start:375 stop:1100 length:726 start_codon:yes stop_codon:yes gene_type:complete
MKRRNKKYLITAGCSFTETVTGAETWPMHLIQRMQGYELVSKGMGSQGNGLISRSVIYEVTNKLKQTTSENISVGIMWSGPTRHETHIDIDHVPASPWKNDDNWIENPTGFIEGYNTWEIINHWWTRPKSKLYYKEFHDPIGDYIQTLEHILRTQWFLEKHNIKYFMSTFTSEVIPEVLKSNIELIHLYELIDFSKFLPISGMHEWAKQTGLPLMPNNAIHPTSKQHEIFVDKVILPFGFK